MPLLKRWLPVVAWSAVILSTSNDQFSATHTGSLLRELFGLPDVINIVLRKLAHLTGYGILGALAFHAARPSPGASRHPLPAGGERGNGGRVALRPACGEKVAEGRMRGVITAILVVIAVASLDEWLQSTVPSRGGSGWDVLLDVVGAAIAIGIMIRVQQLRSRRRTTA